MIFFLEFSADTELFKSDDGETCWEYTIGEKFFQIGKNV